MWDRRLRLLLAFATLIAGSAIALADDKRKAADPALDDELLEFLGSVDPPSESVQPDDGTWIDYLSQTDIGRWPRIRRWPGPSPSYLPQSRAHPGGKNNEWNMAFAGACAAVCSGGTRVRAAGTEPTAAGERARGCALVEPVAGPTEVALAF